MPFCKRRVVTLVTLAIDMVVAFFFLMSIPVHLGMGMSQISEQQLCIFFASGLQYELPLLLCDIDLHCPGEGTVDYSESLDSGWAGESAPALISFTCWLGFQNVCT